MDDPGNKADKAITSMCRAIRQRLPLFLADDSQLHDSAALSDFPNLVRDMASCIDELGVWMKANELNMNNDKTELTSVRTKSKLKRVSANSKVFQDCEITFSESVRNLGVFSDESQWKRR